MDIIEWDTYISTKVNAAWGGVHLCNIGEAHQSTNTFKILLVLPRNRVIRDAYLFLIIAAKPSIWVLESVLYPAVNCYILMLSVIQIGIIPAKAASVGIKMSNISGTVRNCRLLTTSSLSTNVYNLLIVHRSAEVILMGNITKTLDIILRFLQTQIKDIKFIFPEVISWYESIHVLAR